MNVGTRRYPQNAVHVARYRSKVDAEAKTLIPNGLRAFRQNGLSSALQGNQRESRSRRTAIAAGAWATLERRRIRSRSSAIVGRSARLRIAASRKSERDIPACAARSLRVRCTLSGTLRISIRFSRDVRFSINIYAAFAERRPAEP